MRQRHSGHSKPYAKSWVFSNFISCMELRAASYILVSLQSALTLTTLETLLPSRSVSVTRQMWLCWRSVSYGQIETSIRSLPTIREPMSLRDWPVLSRRPRCYRLIDLFRLRNLARNLGAVVDVDAESRKVRGLAGLLRECCTYAKIAELSRHWSTSGALTEGLFVPKPTTGPSCRGRHMLDLGRGVHRCPPTSAVGRGGSY